MAKIQFPTSRSVNDEFSANGRKWKWTGAKWQTVTSEPVTISVAEVVDLAPTLSTLSSSLEAAVESKAAASHTHTLSEVTDYVEPPQAPHPFLTMGA